MKERKVGWGQKPLSWRG